MLIIETPEKGRCVFTPEAIKKGATVEICEYITIPKDQIQILKKTILNDYRFWTDGENGDALLLLGNGSLYNHSKSNANMEIIKQDDGKVWFVAIRDIDVWEELVFDYGYVPSFYPQPTLKILSLVNQKNGK